ncbi:hypothetical protein P7K49_003947 [Saguinus oedipus]|uniref:Uncharacterized protein n=1 Tax=Saguinus oedipus TaxID=9490 RepID=A0ABQ9W5Z7_SAGOE|nr:hypothetical protein P7K49_003947 [Saguinus oedipus]
MFSDTDFGQLSPRNSNQGTAPALDGRRDRLEASVWSSSVDGPASSGDAAPSSCQTFSDSLDRRFQHSKGATPHGGERRSFRRLLSDLRILFGNSGQ